MKYSPPIQQLIDNKEKFLELDEVKRQSILDQLTPEQILELEYCWDMWSRPNQRLPDHDDWNMWLIMGGRFMGKTKAGAEAIREMMCGPTPKEPGKYRKCALIGLNEKAVRDVMVNGVSGILAVHPPEFQPTYISSQARLVWENGAEAIMYSAENPENLRGPQFDVIWADEIAAYAKLEEVYKQIQMSTRLGKSPKQIYTTTPHFRNASTLEKIRDRSRTVLSTGSTFENLANAPQDFVDTILEEFAGTRMGLQEIEGSLIQEVEGALWNNDMIGKYCEVTPEICRNTTMRIVVGVDPTGTSTGDKCGIVVAGVGYDENDQKTFIVLEDASIQGLPDEWAKKTVAMYDKWGADKIVAEKNFGGDMVSSVIKQEDNSVPVELVFASKGKLIRAEPISQLYQQGLVKHNAGLGDLEKEMMEYTGDPRQKSPNSLDAMVWAMTELKGKSSRSKKELEFIKNLKLRGF